MLTATYALLTLSIEQKSERKFISRLLQYVKAIAHRPQSIDADFLASQVDELSRFAERRHQTKVETCVMPAVRDATAEGGRLLADMESLSQLGGAILCSVRKRLRRMAPRGARHARSLCRSLTLYCNNLLARLEMEERELLPLAQRVISNEAWFAIGRSFLVHEADARA